METHPRFETEESRIDAYKELRKKINRQVFSYGHPSTTFELYAPSVIPHSVSECCFYNSERDVYFVLRKTTINGTSFPQVHIYSWDENNTLQEVQYGPDVGGVYYRTELSAPGEDNARSAADHYKLTAEHHAAGLDAIERGITGLPITAQEANELTMLIEGAIPLPPQEGLIPVNPYKP